MTKKHLFFVVRYSILNGEAGSWKITRQEWASYRAQLFDLERLSQRCKLFSGLTLPSVGAQCFDSDVSVSMLVITSAELPHDAYSDLKAAVGAMPDWLDVEVLSVEVDGPSLGSVVQTTVNGALRERYGDGDVAYTTIRLDDDDLLANRYVEKLSRFVRPEFADMVISFPRGFIGTVGAGASRVDHLRHYYAPKVALGMAHVGVWRDGAINSGSRNVFAAGNHAEIDANLPVIVDGSFDAFIRTFHGDNDSGSEVTQQEWISELPEASESVRELFPEEVLGNVAARGEDGSPNKRITQKACQQEIAKLRACRRRRDKLRRRLDAKRGSGGIWKIFR